MNDPAVAPAPSIRPPREHGEAVLLSAANLHKTYRMGRVEVPVLHGASLDVRDGEWVTILGASGSGKSTLLHLLGDLDEADPGHGEVSYRGRSLSTMGRRELNAYRNKTVGFVFQFYHLLPELNVLENTMLPGLVGRTHWVWWPLVFMGVVPALVYEEIMSRRERRRLRDHAAMILESFGLGHRLRHRPRELSGGERQRVAIARALMNEPDVLLADEPTGNLDEHTGREILDLICEQHDKGLTIVMVTHDAAIAERGHRVIKLHDGRIAG
jgi:lipoprotein-releasing system ATP-binding protein